MQATSSAWYSRAKRRRISGRCQMLVRGVMEIRAHGENEFRVFYVARFHEAVYVLHCFVKKTRATGKRDIGLGRQRYAAMLELRRPGRE